MEEMIVDYDDIDNKSDVSDSTLTRSVGSSSSQYLDSTYHPGEHYSKEISFSKSASHHSIDSMEGSVGREKSPPQCNLNGVTKDLIGRQDSTGSQDGSRGSYSFSDSSRSNTIFINKEKTLFKIQMLLPHCCCRILLRLKTLWMLQKLQLIYFGQKPGCGNKILKS